VKGGVFGDGEGGGSGDEEKKRGSIYLPILEG
jgi:hypothetical protein